MSDELQQAKSKESELAAEAREQYHVNNQLKQVCLVFYCHLVFRSRMQRCHLKLAFPPHSRFVFKIDLLLFHGAMSPYAPPACSQLAILSPNHPSKSYFRVIMRDQFGNWTALYQVDLSYGSRPAGAKSVPSQVSSTSLMMFGIDAHGGTPASAKCFPFL